MCHTLLLPIGLLLKDREAMVAMIYVPSNGRSPNSMLLMNAAKNPLLA